MNVTPRFPKQRNNNIFDQSNQHNGHVTLLFKNY